MNASENQPCPLSEQAVGWALHALEPDEEIAVLLHLPRCQACRSAVHDAEDVLANLGAAVEQVAPPPTLRGSILAAASDMQQHVPMVRPRGSSEGVPRSVPAVSPRHRVTPRPAGPPSRVSDPLMSRGSWLSRRGRRLAAASLALIAVLAVGGLAVRTSQLEQQRDAEIAQAQSITDLAERLDRPGVSYAFLADSGDSTIAAVLVDEGERQVFTIGLPSNTANSDIYVLWGIRAGAAPQPLGTFDIAAADQGLRTVGSGAEADDFSEYAISLEPGRVAPASPTDVVARGQVRI